MYSVVDLDICINLYTLAIGPKSLPRPLYNASLLFFYISPWTAITFLFCFVSFFSPPLWISFYFLVFMLRDKYCMYLFCGLPSVRMSILRFIQVTAFINHQLAPGWVMFHGVSIWWLIPSPAEGHWTSYQFGRKPWLPLISINWMSVTWSHHSSEKKGPCMSSSWSPLKWDEDLVGCFHIVNSSELSFAWCTWLPTYVKVCMGKVWHGRNLRAQYHIRSKVWSCLWKHWKPSCMVDWASAFSQWGPSNVPTSRPFLPDIQGNSEFESLFILSSLKTCSIFMMYEK